MPSSPHQQLVENATTAQMIYEYLFVFFDSVSTGRFIVWFLLLYFSLHAVVHRALLRHGRFRAADYGKQSAILVNLMEAALLAFIRLDSPNTKGFHLEKIREAPSLHIMFSMFGLTALWHGDISLLDTTQHAPNPQVMVSMSTLHPHVNMPGPYQHGHHVRGQGPRQPAAQQADRRHHRGAPCLCLHGVWLRP